MPKGIPVGPNTHGYTRGSTHGYNDKARQSLGEPSSTGNRESSNSYPTTLGGPVGEVNLEYSFGFLISECFENPCALFTR
jgi:hypothetical protein